MAKCLSKSSNICALCHNIKRTCMKKAQTWSTDVIIGVTIFLIMSILVLFIVGNFFESKKFENLAGEGELISRGIRTSPGQNAPGFLDGAKLNKGRLDSFANLTYAQIKSAYGLSSDFCIHLEDENGNLINITGNLTGIGSPKAKISGRECATLGIPSVCGDGACTASENCNSCMGDCGTCPLACQLANGPCNFGTCIFSMFSNTNSHAAICGTYNWNVCCNAQGCNINCRTVTNSGNCNPSETQIVTLFSTTNSHVAETAYDNRICCKLTGCSKSLNACKFYDRGLGTGCEPGYSCLASAFSTTNAHVAGCDYYQYNICCRAS